MTSELGLSHGKLDLSFFFMAGPKSVWTSELCECVCVNLYLCRGSNYFKVLSDWLILDVDLYGTIFVGGPLQTQFDIVVSEVVFFAFLYHNICFQIFGQLKDIPMI